MKRLEYCMILLVLTLLAGAQFGGTLRLLGRRRAFWISMGMFLVTCGMLDAYAVRMSWWYFDWSRVLGVSLFAVPLEEFGLFVLIYVLAVGWWEQ